MVKSLVLLLLACSIAFAESGASKPIIKIRAEQWDQYTYEDGSGYFYELIKAVYEPLGYQISFKFCPWRRCILDMLQDRADIIIGVYKEDVAQEGRLQIPHYPIHKENNAVLFKRDNIGPWQGQKSMTDKLLAQVRGYDMDKRLEVSVKSVEVTDLKQGVKLIMANRADFLISGKADLEREVQDYLQAGENLQIEPVFKHNAYLGFRNSANGSQLANEFDQAYLKLYKTGFLKQLQTKWQLDFPLLDQGQ